MKRVPCALRTIAQLMLVVSLAACGAPGTPSEEADKASSTTTQTDSSTRTPEEEAEAQAAREAEARESETLRPVDSLEELTSLAGFDFVVPVEVEGFGAARLYTGVPKKLAVVNYGEADTSLMVRKGRPQEGGDLTRYTEGMTDERTVDVDGFEVTIAGNDDVYRVAIWSDGGFDYAVVASQGLDEDVLLALVEQIA